MLSFPGPNSYGSVPAVSINNWIVIHQRTSTDSNFTNNWSDYKDGFGDLAESFWMGNEKVYLLTQNGSISYMLRVEMLSTGNQWRSAEYSSFSLDDESHNYTLHVDGYSGDAGDSLQYTGSSMTLCHDGMKFSTFDVNNDLYGNRNYGCSKHRGGGGWWFNACLMCCLTCDTPNYSWWTNPSNDVYLQISRMMIKYG